MASQYDMTLDPTKKKSGFEDEVESQSAFQQWLGTQEQAQAQAAVPQQAQQPQSSAPIAPPQPGAGVVQPFVVPAPPPPPPPLPVVPTTIGDGSAPGAAPQVPSIAARGVASSLATASPYVAPSPGGGRQDQLLIAGATPSPSAPGEKPVGGGFAASALGRPSVGATDAPAGSAPAGQALTGAMPDAMTPPRMDDSQIIDFSSWIRPTDPAATDTGQADKFRADLETKTAAPAGGDITQLPGYGDTWGPGWHDGTPEGKAAWEAAGSPGAGGAEGGGGAGGGGGAEGGGGAGGAGGAEGGGGGGGAGAGAESGAAPAPSVVPDRAGSQTSDAAGAWNQEFSNWVRGQMASPSRYDSDLVKQGQVVLKDALDRERTEGMQRIKEHFVGRGLLSGSTLEDRAVREFEAQLQEQYRKQLFELGREQAMTWAADVGVAGQLGLGVGAQLSDREAMFLMDERQRISLRLQERGLDQASADREADRQLERELADANRDFEQNKWEDYVEGEYGGVEEEVVDEATATTTGATPKIDPTHGGLGFEPELVDPAAKPESEAQAADLASTQNVLRSTPIALAGRQQAWDAFAAKYGVVAAQRLLGKRPTR